MDFCERLLPLTASGVAGRISTGHIALALFLPEPIVLKRWQGILSGSWDRILFDDRMQIRDAAIEERQVVCRERIDSLTIFCILVDLLHLVVD